MVALQQFRGRLSVFVGVLVLALGLAVSMASSAQAGPYRQGCSAWAHSTSAWTSGVSAICTGGPSYVQYRVVGLCINKYWGSSRWVYGWWMNDGVSHYGCGWNERAGATPFFQTR